MNDLQRDAEVVHSNRQCVDKKKIKLCSRAPKDVRAAFAFMHFLHNPLTQMACSLSACTNFSWFESHHAKLKRFWKRSSTWCWLCAKRQRADGCGFFDVYVLSLWKFCVACWNIQQPQINPFYNTRVFNALGEKMNMHCNFQWTCHDLNFDCQNTYSQSRKES